MIRKYTGRHPLAILLVLLICQSSMAIAGPITFDGLSHGEIVTTQLAPFVTISATNPNRPHDLAIIFDTTATGTADPDLEGPPWSGGNLPSSTVLGNALIIAENDIDVSPADGLIDDPDDEGSRPSGTLTFELGTMLGTKFGFDVIDIEGNILEASSVDFYAGAALLGSISFADFQILDPTITFGNNTLNRVGPFSLSQLGLASPFDKMVINVGGSSAYDNIVVPEPSTGLMLASFALAGMLFARRRQGR